MTPNGVFFSCVRWDGASSRVPVSVWPLPVVRHARTVCSFLFRPCNCHADSSVYVWPLWGSFSRASQRVSLQKCSVRPGRSHVIPTSFCATLSQNRVLQVATFAPFAPSCSARATVTQIRGLVAATLAPFAPSSSARATVTQVRGLVAATLAPFPASCSAHARVTQIRGHSEL